MDKRQMRAVEGFAAESGAELLRIAALLTSDPHTAEDVYQETLQLLAARWSKVDSPKAFCRRVILNIVIDQARARARRPQELRLFDGADRSDPRSADPHAAVELRSALRAALDSLGVQQRAVVVLRYFDDRSEAEVAGLLGITTGTVKSTASRAINDMLWNPLVPPPLRAALFRVLAATPGVRVNASARDTAARRAVEISRTDSLSKDTTAAFENPATGGVVELTTAYPANTGGGPNKDPNAAYVGYDLVMSITRASTVAPDPYSR